MMDFLFLNGLDELDILLDYVQCGPLLYAHLTHFIGEVVQLLPQATMFPVS